MRSIHVATGLLLLFARVAAGADDVSESTLSNGILKSIDSSKIVLAGPTVDKGVTSERSFKLKADVQIKIDGDDAKFEKLALNSPVLFTYDKNKEVFRVSQKQRKGPGSGSPGGLKIKAIADGRLTPNLGYSWDLPTDVKVKIDGKDTKVSDLKVGDRFSAVMDEHGKILLIEVGGK